VKHHNSDLPKPSGTTARNPQHSISSERNRWIWLRTIELRKAATRFDWFVCAAKAREEWERR